MVWQSKQGVEHVEIRNQLMVEEYALVLIVPNYIAAICRLVLYRNNRQSTEHGVRDIKTICWNRKLSKNFHSSHKQVLGVRSANVVQNVVEALRFGEENVMIPSLKTEAWIVQDALWTMKCVIRNLVRK